MTAPTLVSTTQTANWTNTSSQTIGPISVQAGDLLEICAASEDSGSTVSISGGSLTYTLQKSLIVSGYCATYLWTAPITSTGSVTITVIPGGSYQGTGGVARLWRGSSGIGASAVAHGTGAGAVAPTTTGADSAIGGIVSDWNAVNGSSRTWDAINGSTITGDVYAFASGGYTVYSGHAADSGAIGAKTFGLSAPTGMAYAALAVEILGSGSSGAIAGTAAITFGQAGALAGVGALLGSAALTFGGSATLSGAGTLAGSSAITLGQSGTLAASGALSGMEAITFGESGALAASGLLQGSSAIVFGASATGGTPATLTGSGAIAFGESGVLTGSGALTGTAAVMFGPVATLGGLGALQASGSISFSGQASLYGLASIQGAASVTTSASALVAGLGRLFGATSISFSVSGELLASGSLAGMTDIVFSARSAPNGAPLSADPRYVVSINARNFSANASSRKWDSSIPSRNFTVS